MTKPVLPFDPEILRNSEYAIDVLNNSKPFAFAEPDGKRIWEEALRLWGEEMPGAILFADYWARLAEHGIALAGGDVDALKPVFISPDPAKKYFGYKGHWEDRGLSKILTSARVATDEFVPEDIGLSFPPFAVGLLRETWKHGALMAEICSRDIGWTDAYYDWRSRKPINFGSEEKPFWRSYPDSYADAMRDCPGNFSAEGVRQYHAQAKDYYEGVMRRLTQNPHLDVPGTTLEV